MITDNKSKLQPGENQHIRLKLDQVKVHYADGLITAAGLLYYAIGVMRPPGQELVLTVAQWLELTGLKERTFYKAKAKLVAQGKLAERVEGVITLKYESSVIDLSEKRARKGADATESSDCPIVQNDCPNGQDDCPIVQNDCPNGQDDCPIVQNEALKPLSNKAFSESTDITNKADKAAPQSAALSASQKNEEMPNSSNANLSNDNFSKDSSDQVLLSILEKKLSSLPPGLSRQRLANKIKQISVRKQARQNTQTNVRRLEVHQLYPMYLFEGENWETVAQKFGHSEEAIAEFKELLRCQK